MAERLDSSEPKKVVDITKSTPTKDQENGNGQIQIDPEVTVVIVRRTYEVTLTATEFITPSEIDKPGSKANAISRARKQLNRMEVQEFSGKGVQIGDYYISEEVESRMVGEEMEDGEEG